MEYLSFGEINSRDSTPLAERDPEASSYAYVLNNPIYYIDPDGRTEYPSYATYKKALGSSALLRQDMWKQGHWLYSDRMYHPSSWSGAVTRRSSVFNNAAALNTANGRSGDYTPLPHDCIVWSPHN